MVEENIEERNKLYKLALEVEEVNKGLPIQKVDSEIIKVLLSNSRIKLTEESTFFCEATCIRIMEEIYFKREKELDANRLIHEVSYENNIAEDIRVFSTWYDFGHTTPNWNNVLKYGIFGFIQYNRKALENKDLTDVEKLNYSCRLTVLSAVDSYILKVADEADTQGKTMMAKGLRNLSKRAPQTLFEAMQTIIVWYDMQQNVEGSSIRTLGRFDELLFPYYLTDKQRGMSELQVRKLIRNFLQELASYKVGADLPFMLGGMKKGISLVNELSYLILEEYLNLGSVDLKLHFLYDDRLPQDFIDMAFKGISNGSNSIVFMNEKIVRKSLNALGLNELDVENYSVLGCYEPSANEEVECSCAGRVNLPKILEIVLGDGKDLLFNKKVTSSINININTFEEFYNQFIITLKEFCRKCMQMLCVREKYFFLLHAGLLFSSTLNSCMQNGRDVYCNFAAKYNNTSIVAVGLATATDSLVAIKQLVFTDKIVSLTQLISILRDNWNGKEDLRQKVIKNLPKYGNNNEEADFFARDMISIMAQEINRKPNAKGGIYRLGAFSVDWRFEFGEKTAASADGRNAKETISKNYCASLGSDKEGVTALILSSTKFGQCDTPDGAVLDIVLHPTAVRGKEGLICLRGLIKTFMDLNGFSIHMNVLDSKVLEEAQRYPELYPNLQVRLCGWNVLFSSLSKKEQLEFIIQAKMSE